MELTATSRRFFSIWRVKLDGLDSECLHVKTVSTLLHDFKGILVFILFIFLVRVNCLNYYFDKLFKIYPGNKIKQRNVLYDIYMYCRRSSQIEIAVLNKRKPYSHFRFTS